MVVGGLDSSGLLEGEMGSKALSGFPFIIMGEAAAASGRCAGATVGSIEIEERPVPAEIPMPSLVLLPLLPLP